MVYIVRTAWAGLSGGPGITQLAFDADPVGGFIDASTAQSVVNAVRTFFDAQKAYLSTDTSLTVSPAIDSYDTATGELGSTVVAATAPVTVVGTSPNAYSMASGYKFDLRTAGIKNNRRVRGGLFVVPAVYTAYDTNGGIDTGVRTTANTAAATLLSTLVGLNLDLHVWSRPKESIPGNDGSSYAVTSMAVSTKVAILRGRRG